MARRKHIPIPNENTNFTGSVTIQGLNIAGRISIVSIDNLVWTPLPAVPLVKRNAMSIQNISGQNVKIQYDPLTVGWVGVKIAPDSERFYDIQANVIIYVKSETSAVDILVEELS